MEYLTEKYILFVSSRLLRFKKLNSSTYNFRCPFCGDSKKSRTKARAYLYERNGQFWFACHNCSKPVGTFENFLKLIDYGLFSEYFIEKLGGKEETKFECVDPTQYDKPAPVFKTEANPLDSIDKLSALSPFDLVRSYVASRRIPTQFYDILYACRDFKKFTNKLIPGKFNEKSLAYDDYRLLIPFFDENKRMFAYAGRSLEANSQLRYIQITLDDSKPKLFGMERWNKESKTYVLEGPLDSLFLPNAIATGGGNLVTDLGDHKENIVVCYDNEPKSETTVDKMRRAIAHDFAVCIWPKELKHKDINKMVLAGIAPAKIENIINSNTFTGLEAEVRLNLWSVS